MGWGDEEEAQPKSRVSNRAQVSDSLKDVEWGYVTKTNCLGLVSLGLCMYH